MYPLWSQNFETESWQQQWQVRRGRDWGWKNATIQKTVKDSFRTFLRVHYPQGSSSKSFALRTNAPMGGLQFYATPVQEPTDRLNLRYYVRFADPFDFVKGGKLPGLFGGVMHSGRKVPDGTNGFSTRYMWREQGAGEVYAYLPSSKDYGTSLGRGAWHFQPGRWHCLEQEVTLNTPRKRDGSIRVWVDGKQVLGEQELLFRTVDSLKIEGILFSTFFGGRDASWAPPHDTSVDFAAFAIAQGYIGTIER